MSKSRVFFVILISFIAGVFIQSFFGMDQSPYFLLLIFSLIFLAVFYKNKKIIILSFAVLFFIFGAWHTDNKIKGIKNLPYDNVALQGKAVVEKVSLNAFGQNLIIKLENLPTDEAGISLLAQVPKYPEYFYGEKLEISCLVKSIENLPAGEIGGNAEFDYKMYMAKDGVLYSCKKPDLQKTGENNGNMLLNGILKIRRLFENNIRAVIPQPEGALANGLLLGGSSELSKEIQNNFSKTGMAHIVAVSGYNVTIIAEYLLFLGITLGLWRRQAIWFAIVGIILFVIMSGLPASAVRAGVMGSILLWAMKNGRLANSKNAVVFAAAIMLLMNPLLLRWDIGFQLSFLATLGIVASSSFWEKSFIKKYDALGITEIIIMSLSAQIFVLPIIAYNFHMTSVVSLLANILILPIIPLSMLLVFLSAIGGFISYYFSLVLAWLAFLPLAYEIKIINFLSSFSWSSISIKEVDPWFVFLYYIILGIGIFYFKRMQNLKIKMENDR